MNEPLTNGNIRKNELILDYQGAFDYAIIAKYGNNLKNKYGKKFLSVFIELAQNISQYSQDRIKIAEDKIVGYGKFEIVENIDYFYLKFWNKTNEHHKIKLEYKLNVINQLDREQLRKYRIEMSGLPAHDDYNANIGLISVKLDTNEKLNYEFEKINDDNYIFTLITKIKRK